MEQAWVAVAVNLDEAPPVMCAHISGTTASLATTMYEETMHYCSSSGHLISVEVAFRFQCKTQLCDKQTCTGKKSVVRMHGRDGITCHDTFHSTPCGITLQASNVPTKQ